DVHLCGLCGSLRPLREIRASGDVESQDLHPKEIDMRVATLWLAVLLAAGVPACGAADGDEGGEGSLGAASQAQLEPPGWKDYLIYTLADVYGNQVGKVLVTATAGDGYAANREYWYMTSNLSNSSAVTFSGGTSQYWSNPPSGLGTLSFTTVRTPT